MKEQLSEIELKKLPKEDLEKRINDLAKKYISLRDQEDNDKIMLRKRLLESIYIYCKEHKVLIKGVSKDDICFNTELIEWFDRTIKNLDLNKYTTFINLLNAATKKFLIKQIIFTYHDDNNNIVSISSSERRKFINIHNKSAALATSEKIPENYISWKEEDKEIISRICNCTIEDINNYISYNHNVYRIKTETRNLSIYDEEDNNSPWDETENNEIDKFDISELIEKIYFVYSQEKEAKKPRISKLLTYHFIVENRANNIDYPFIDKGYAAELEAGYKTEGKYPTLKQFSKDNDDSNPGQTLERFFEKVREYK